MKERPYANPYLGGIVLGLVLFMAFMLTGAGLGASAAINRVQIAIVDLVAPSHVDNVAYFAQTAGGNKSALNDPSILMMLGTLLGGLISGLVAGRVKPELRRGPNISKGTRLVTALIGGILIGYGARLARGCSSGQALTGGAVLSVGSWAFMLAFFGGAYILAYFVRRLWN